MEPHVHLAFKNLVDEGLTLRDLVENAIDFAAQAAVEEHQFIGVKLDQDDCYDAIVEGVRSSAERRAVDHFTASQPIFDPPVA